MSTPTRRRAPRRAGRRRLGAVVPLALTGALLVGGCQSDPDVAVDLGADRLEMSELDAATAALCGYFDEAQLPAVPRTAVRDHAVEAWTYADGLSEIAEQVGIETAELSRVTRGLADELAGIDGVDLDSGLANRISTGVLLRQELLSRLLQSQGIGVVTAPTPEIVAAADDELLTQASADLDDDAVEVNPRVGVYAEGRLEFESAGLSVAATDTATRARGELLMFDDVSGVADLTASQRCGQLAEEAGEPVPEAPAE